MSCLLVTQFGFVPERGTTEAIFVWQLQEKYPAVNKQLYMAFLDLEKAFDLATQKVIWWALRKLIRCCGMEHVVMPMLEVVPLLEMKVGSIRTPYTVPCSASLCWRFHSHG